METNHILSLLLVAAVAAIFIQRSTIGTLRARNSMLYRDNARMVEDSHKQ